ncbi:MAG: hypothetical protein KGL39_17840 [Patescibacteria group bacterium]|nr:hypothetical protein [Patescibacteria group bacterium]
MSEDAINAMLTEASAANTAADNKEHNTQTSQPTDKPATDAKPAEGSEPKENFRTPWPKSAIDVMNRKDKKIAAANEKVSAFEKQLKDAAFLRQRLQELEPPAPAADPNDPAPDISKYDDWVKYNRDLTAYNLRQLQKAQSANKTDESAKVDPQKALWRQQRSQNTATKAAELLKAHPEYMPVFHQTADLIDDLPETTKDLLLATDNPALAVLQMLQDGTLNDLPHMAPPLAERVIMKAMADSGALLNANSDDDGEPPAPINTVSRAPAPMKESKTSKAGTKDPTNMSDADFRAAFL